MNDHPPELYLERLRSGLDHAIELMEEGSASAIMVTAVLNGRKVKIWAAGDDEIRQKMESVMQQILYAPMKITEVSATDGDDVPPHD